MTSDEALFERLVQGDMRAFDQLYARWARSLFGFVCNKLHDRAEAEDVLHEAFVSVLRERQRGTKINSFRSWLFEVARNLCKNRVRSRKRDERAVETLQQATERPLAHAAEQALEQHQLVCFLERKVANLPDALSELYRLRAAGMSYDEMSTVLDVPVGTIKSRMHELMKRLREQVRP